MSKKNFFRLCFCALLLFSSACKVNGGGEESSSNESSSNESESETDKPTFPHSERDIVLPTGTERGTIDAQVLQDDDGTIRIMNGRDAIASLSFKSFNANWSLLLFSAGAQGAGGEKTKTANNNGNTIRVSTRTQLNGTLLTITADVVAENADYFSNSSHMEIMLDPSFWANGTFQAQGNPLVSLPARVDQSVWQSGQTSRMVATGFDRFQMTMQTTQQRAYHIQDSRGYSFGFEIRGAMESNVNFVRGVSRQYQITLDLGSSLTYKPTATTTVTQGSEWIPVRPSVSFQRGSALDWSYMNTSAAGSKGWLKAIGGKFYFENEPGTEVRFVGANLSHYANFPTHAEAEQMADNISALGYNTVRLHHIDQILTMDTAGNSVTLNANYLDKLNYLFAALKNRGIYLSIDLFSLRDLRNNEIIPGDTGMGEFKALYLANDSLRQNLLTYASRLLEQTNPYTGLKWKDDPALAWVNICNENNPMWMTGVNGVVRDQLTQAQGGTAWDPAGNPHAAFALAKSVAVEMRNRLLQMGVKALITDQNVGGEAGLLQTHEAMDWADNHVYWGMPRSYTPYTYINVSPLRQLDWVGWGAATTRPLGKPFTMTEWGPVGLMSYRGEMGLFLGAAASIQQWNGLWAFDYADNMYKAFNSEAISGSFAMTTDPLRLATERALVTLFRRGDLTHTEAPDIIRIDPTTGPLGELRDLGIANTNIIKKPMAISSTQGTSTPGQRSLDGMIETSTGSVASNINLMTMKISTPKTAGVIGAPGQTLETATFGAHISGSRATAWVSSLDGQNIEDSNRLLLVHVTDLSNTNASWSNFDRSIITNWGTLPHLAKQGTLEVKVKSNDPTRMVVYRLDLQGKRISQVPVTAGNNAIGFQTSIRGTDGYATFYYEIVKE